VQGLMWHNAALGSSGNDFWGGNRPSVRPLCLGKSEITIGIT
jgi:hypothetical protein